MYTLSEFRNTPILVTDGRIRSTEHTTEGLYRYDIRHDDSEGDPTTIENHVWVNHYGSILSRERLDLDVPSWKDERYIQLSEDEKWSLFGDHSDVTTLEDYINRVGNFTVNIYLGLPTIELDNRTYTVRHFNRESFDPELPDTAYLFNGWVLPVRGALQSLIGAVLLPGIYLHNEHVLVLVPPGNMAEYSASNLKGNLA